jgi:hypothetical protein
MNTIKQVCFKNQGYLFYFKYNKQSNLTLFIGLFHYLKIALRTILTNPHPGWPDSA